MTERMSGASLHATYVVQVYEAVAAMAQEEGIDVRDALMNFEIECRRDGIEIWAHYAREARLTLCEHDFENPRTPAHDLLPRLDRGLEQ